MRKFSISARRFSSVVLPFTSPFIKSSAAAQRAADPAADRAKRSAEAAQAMSPHSYATAAIRLSRMYW